VGAKLFKTAIVMISDIGIGLAESLGNLSEGISLEEVQLQRRLLIFG
jgi:hypothetical protein